MLHILFHIWTSSKFKAISLYFDTIKQQLGKHVKPHAHILRQCLSTLTFHALLQTGYGSQIEKFHHEFLSFYAPAVARMIVGPLEMPCRLSTYSSLCDLGAFLLFWNTSVKSIRVMPKNVFRNLQNLLTGQYCRVSETKFKSDVFLLKAGS